MKEEGEELEKEKEEEKKEGVEDEEAAAIKGGGGGGERAMARELVGPTSPPERRRPRHTNGNLIPNSSMCDPLRVDHRTRQSDMYLCVSINSPQYTDVGAGMSERLGRSGWRRGGGNTHRFQAQ